MVKKEYYVKRVQYGSQLRYSFIESVKVHDLRISSFFRDFEKSSVGEKRLRDLKRSKRNFIEKSIHNFSNEKSLSLITLTYSENFQDLSIAKSHIALFFRKLNSQFKKVIKYSYVFEFQSRGAIHFHILINVSKNNVLKKSILSWKKFNVNCQGVDVRRVRKPIAAINYLTKYMVKEYESIVELSKIKTVNLNVKLYQFSKSCVMPNVEIFLIDLSDVDFLRIFASMSWGYMYQCRFHDKECLGDYVYCDHVPRDFCVEGCLGFHGFSSRSDVVNDPIKFYDKKFYAPICLDLDDLVYKKELFEMARRVDFCDFMLDKGVDFTDREYYFFKKSFI